MRGRDTLRSFFVAAVFAGCAASPGVETLSARDSVTSTTSIIAATTTTVALPTSTTTATTAAAPPTTIPVPPTTVPSGELRLAVDGLALRVRRTPTVMDDGLDVVGYSGFHDAVQLDSGTIIASGFDDLVVQPERSALWRSFDGLLYERIGKDITRLPGQQSILAVLELDGRVLAIGNDLGGTTFEEIQEADAIRVLIWISDDQGDTWTTEEVADHAVVSAVEVFGSRLILSIVSDPFASARGGTLLWPGGGAPSDLAEGSGVAIGSLEALDDGTLIAVGLRCEADADCPPLGLAIGLPTAVTYDLAVWRSSDGVVWTEEETGFEGAPGLQFGASVSSQNGQIVVAVVELEDTQMRVRLVTPTDDRWMTLVDLGERSTDEIVVLVELVPTGRHLLVSVGVVSFARQMSVNELVLVDPSTGEFDRADVFDRTGVSQVEAIRLINGYLVGFGRTDDNPGNDLQQLAILTG